MNGMMNKHNKPGTEAAKNHSTQFNLMPKIGDINSSANAFGAIAVKKMYEVVFTDIYTFIIK